MTLHSYDDYISEQGKTTDEEVVSVDSFLSDDGNHLVYWASMSNEGDVLEYPQWWCTDHDRSYYRECMK